MNFKLFSILVLLIAVTSCQFFDKKSSENSVKFIRFDQDFQKFNLKDFDKSDKQLLDKYGDLYTFYTDVLMGLKDKSDPTVFPKLMQSFLTGEYPAMMDTINRLLIPKLPSIEVELGIAYSNLKKVFPTKNPSKIYTMFISPMGANPQAAFSYGNDTIGINLLNYLGRSFSLYEPIYKGYNYMIEWNSPEYLTRNVMLVEYNLLKEKFPTNDLSDELYMQIIEEGKKYYYLDKICPEMKDWTKIGYSEAQYKWCIENEFEAWSYFKEHKLLYSTDNLDIQRYSLEGPTTPGMPAESPGMVGTWLGWQIVKEYAKFTGKSLSDIMSTSPKEILSKASYKPKK